MSATDVRLGRYPLRFLVRRPVQAARDFLINHRSKFAHEHLLGLEGVEVGASAANDFRLDTVNVDKADNTFYADDQIANCGRAATVDVRARGDDLPFEDDSYDFVLTSHVIEHMPDPIRALREWMRVARRYVFVVVPHRDRTFDHDRELTPVAELLERHEKGFWSEDDTHWSVWTAESFLEMCEQAGIPVIEYQDPDDKRCNGFAVLIDARAGAQQEAPPRRRPSLGPIARRVGTPRFLRRPAPVRSRESAALR